MVKSLSLSLSVVDCPHFDRLWLTHADIFQDVFDAMRSSMWHKDQKVVRALLLAIAAEA